VDGKCRWGVVHALALWTDLSPKNDLQGKIRVFDEKLPYKERERERDLTHVGK
jgi:hypothetical protein